MNLNGRAIFHFFFGTWKDRLTVIAIVMLALAVLPLVGVAAELGNVPEFVLALPAIFLVACLVIAAAVGPLLGLAGADFESSDIAKNLTDSTDGQEILRRWIVRARWHRYVGGVAGVAFAAGLGSHYLVCSLLGIMVGSVISETARLGRVVQGGRSADLTPRPVRRYTSTSEQYALYGLGVTALAILMVLASQDGLDTSLAELSVWFWPASIVLLVAVVLAVQRRVVYRRRPSMAAHLASTDDILRYLTNTRSLADPALALGFALLSETFGVWEDTSGPAIIASVVAGALSIGMWWQNRRLGLDKLRDIKPVEVTTPQAAAT